MALLRSALWRHGAPWTLLLLVLGAAVLAAPWATWGVIAWEEHKAYEHLEALDHDRLTLYGGALSSELERFRNIPVVLSSDHDVADLLSVPREAESPDEAILAFDRRLKLLSRSLGGAAIYLLDRNGIAIASSNWDEGAGSFVGQHLQFRPYFRSALHGREGEEFAIGTTAYQPGYYDSEPVRINGAFAGAVTVKTSMDGLEHSWSGGGERVFVTDQHGIVVITNTPAWRFHALTPLSPGLQHELQASRQYGDEPLPPLGTTPRGALTSVQGSTYVMVSQPVSGSDGWTLHVLLDVREAEANARARGLLDMAAVGITMLGLLFIVYHSRLLRLHARDLEVQVSERTAELLASNRRLRDEVAERERTQVELKANQDALVQAAKLAALGQMSAGMAHEINQPLAAIRSYADNAQRLLDLGRTGTARENLGEIADLTERMARITGQLKQFARKSSGSLEAVQVADAVQHAVALMAGVLTALDVTLTWEPPPDDIRVMADEVQLQQVLINLCRNALDAMRAGTERQLAITVAADDRRVTLAVRDTGPGIDASVMPRLFEPFFTTKGAGEGLGLGLSISDGIIRSFGGQITAANLPGGGAQFTVTLSRLVSP